MSAGFAAFWVGGVHGKCRPRASARNGGVRVHRAPQDTVWEAKVAALFRATGCSRLDGPVRVCIDVYGELPRSRPRRVESEPYTVRPDADNVAKWVLDGLNGLAWRDDAQVTELTVVKHDRGRGEAPRTLVRVSPAGTRVEEASDVTGRSAGWRLAEGRAR